jgi:hypothetical protein
MAAVFMLAGSTIFSHTMVVPRWTTYLGRVLAVLLLLSIGTLKWVSLVFPLWVAVISVCVLLTDHTPSLQSET